MCDALTRVNGSDIAVIDFPSQQAFTAVPGKMLIKKVTGKVSAVQHLRFTKQNSAISSWDNVTIECVVLIDTFESVVSVDISKLRPFLDDLLSLNELFVFHIIVRETFIFHSSFFPLF